MNKETKIAKGFMKDYKEDIVGFLNKDYPKTLGLKFICKTHKQTCQRWLEFLEKALSHFAYGDIRLESKIKDLKQTIKLYDEVEIK